MGRWGSTLNGAKLLPAAGILLLLNVWVTGAQQVERERPTKTWKQKEHGKLYRSYGGHRKLTEIEPGKDITVLHGAEPPVRPYGPDYTRPSEYLSKITCSSDAIVIGRPTGETSALTEGENFIFSDHSFAVEEVLKNNPRQSIQPSTEIVVTRPGGRLKLGNRWIRAEDEDFKPFQLGGRYLLYLRFISATGSYHAFGERSFELRADKFFRLSKFYLWNEKKFPLLDTSSFLSEVRFARAEPCPQ